jgi:hypothetical protein
MWDVCSGTASFDSLPPLLSRHIILVRTINMSKPPQDLQDRYYLVGIRSDGSRTVYLGGMTWDTANRALAFVNEAGIFTRVQIELEDSERTHRTLSA